MRLQTPTALMADRELNPLKWKSRHLVMRAFLIAGGAYGYTSDCRSSDTAMAIITFALILVRDQTTSIVADCVLAGPIRVSPQAARLRRTAVKTRYLSMVGKSPLRFWKRAGSRRDVAQMG
jgi:hypothetical protein